MNKTAVGAIGCGGVFLVSLLVIMIGVAIAYRNTHPSPSKDEVPDSVSSFTLQKINSATAGVTGNERSFDVEYSSKLPGSTAKINYILRNHANNVLAMLWSDLPCTKATSEGQMKNKSGAVVGKFAFCTAADQHFLTLNKGSQTVTVIPTGRDQAPSTMQAFFSALPFASDIDLSSMGFAADAETPGTGSHNSTPPGAVLSAYDLADSHQRSKAIVARYNGMEITVHGYISIPPTVTKPSFGGLVGVGENKESIHDRLKQVDCWFDGGEVENFAKLKGGQYITVRGRFDGSSYSPELRSCTLASPE